MPYLDLMQAAQSLDRTFTALADPTRRKILARLALGEATVNELAEPFAISQPAISRHIRVLSEAGLIVQRVDGTKRPCRLTPEAPSEAVYRAHIDPKLIQQWCLGPEGWTMPVCINEAKPGGKIRYEWSNGKGGGFFLTGEILELDPPHRIVHVERMHLPDAT